MKVSMTAGLRSAVSPFRMQQIPQPLNSFGVPKEGWVDSFVDARLSDKNVTICQALAVDIKETPVAFSALAVSVALALTRWDG